MADRWYYLDQKNVSHGPVSTPDLRALLRDNCKAISFICPEAGADWTESRYHPLFRDIVTTNQIIPTMDDVDHPWRRYFARQLDIWLCLVVIGVILGLFLIKPDRSGEAPPWLIVFFPAGVGLALAFGGLLFVVMPLLIIIEILLLTLFKTTFGKWLFFIKITTVDGLPLSFGKIAKRTLLVNTVGCGLGLTLAYSISNIVAYRKLKVTNSSYWDRKTGCQVTYGPIGTLRWILIAAVLLIALSSVSAVMFALEAIQT